MRKGSTAIGYGAAILYPILIGFSPFGNKVCLLVSDPLMLLTWRYNIGLAVAAVLIGCRLIKIERKGKRMAPLFLTAAFYVAFMALQTWGLAIATSIEAGIVFAIVPILAVIVARFFLKESTTLLQNAFIVLSVIGVAGIYVFQAEDVGISGRGFFILLLSSLAMALCNVFMRYVRREFRPVQVSTCILIGGCIFFNLVALIRILSGNLAASAYLSPMGVPSFVLSAAYLGIACILFSSALVALAVARLDAARGTIFGNLSIVFSITAGIVFLREPFYAYHLICTVLILAGVLGTSLAAKRPERPLS